MLRVVDVGKYGGSHTLYVNGSWYVGISFVISDARDCRLENCHITRSSSQLGSCKLSDEVFIISPPPPPTTGPLPDFLLLIAANNFDPPFAPLYSCECTSEPWPFINTLSLRSISSRIDGKKSINFFYLQWGRKKKRKRELNILAGCSTKLPVLGAAATFDQGVGEKPIIDWYCRGLLYFYPI